MEVIVKFLKAFFYGADGEVDATFLQKFKRSLLWIILGAGLAIGGLIYFVPDDEDEDDEIEYVYYDEDGNEITEEEYYALGGE